MSTTTTALRNIQISESDFGISERIFLSNGATKNTYKSLCMIRLRVRAKRTRLNRRRSVRLCKSQLELSCKSTRSAVAERREDFRQSSGAKNATSWKAACAAQAAYAVAHRAPCSGLFPLCLPRLNTQRCSVPPVSQLESGTNDLNRAKLALSHSF